MCKNTDSNDIAIISMACRFPDAINTQEFWDNLINGKSSIKEIPIDRWSLENFYSKEPKNAKSVSKYGSFLNDIKKFDPNFFKMNENDIEIIDPQQRILIELAYETIISSKYSLDDLKGKKVGVFLGITKSDYQENLQDALLAGKIKQSTLVIGILRNLIAARISNLFDFQGVSLTIDTACSSSLVAIQSAKESILNNSSELALVGGINLNISPIPYYGMSMAGALTSSDKYKVFDTNSNGFIMGEGGGLVLLKKLDKAIEDKDFILGVIKGSSVNNDGKSLSPMAPRPSTQQYVVYDAYKDAKIDPKIVTYIEAHGTGTALGDAIEANTIIKNFKSNTFIGSVKPNIGHLLSGSGIAGLIKSLLIIKNRTIPPLINYDLPRKDIRLEELGFILNKEPVKINDNQIITIGINSFGFGGTNAHIVLQEYKDNRNNIQSFKQIVPNYNKKEYWVDSEKKDNKSKISLYTQDFIKKEIESFKEDKSNVYIFSSYTNQDFVHELIKNLKLNNIEAKVTFDTKDINNPLSTIIFIEPKYPFLLSEFQNIYKNSNINKILVITTNSIVTDEQKEIDDLNRFILSGLVFSSISEFPNIKITQIDFDKKYNNNEKITNIISEIQSNYYENLIVYRNNQRLIPKLYELNNLKPITNIIKGGIYLITGITGIMSEIIKHISTYQVNLIVCSRRTQENIKDWEEIEKFVYSKNSTIKLIKTDITNNSDVKNLFEIIKKDYKNLNGIIHGAGIVIPNSFENKTLEEFEDVLAPKVKGIQLINEELDKYNFKPDFIISFSSLSSSVIGLNRGISDYSTANFFLDQYSKLMNNNGKNFRVINWGAWEEKGMASNTFVLKKLSESGINAISLNDGTNIFDKILNSNYYRVVALNAQKELFESLFFQPNKKFNTNNTSNISEIKHNNKISLETNHSLKIDSLNTTKKLEKFLLELVAEELNNNSSISLPDITIDTNLLDLGIDSLSAIDMAKKLQDIGFKDIPFELFFEYQTIRAISEFLLKDKNIDSLDIEDNDENEYYLSPLQKAFYSSWVISDSLSFSFQRQTIMNNIDIDILEQCVHILLEKHHQLRANFFIDKKTDNEELNIKQKISHYDKYKDSKLIEIINSDKNINNVENDFVNQKFDLENDLLFKIVLFKDNNQTHILFLFHHIIFDGVSMKIFSEELWNNYSSLIKKQNLPTKKIKTNYFDYIKYLITRNDLEDLKWWKNYLIDKKITLGSLKDKDFISLDKDNISLSYSNNIELNLRNSIDSFSQNKQIPLQVIYLKAYFDTLFKFLNSDEIIINLAISGRDIQLPDINKVIGCFADTYPVYSNKNISFESLREHLKDIKRHQNISSTEIVKIFKDLNKQYSFFSFSFAVFDKKWSEELDFIDFKETLMRGFNINTKFALTFWEDINGINYTINYPKDLFSKSELDIFSNIFNQSLKNIIDGEKIPLIKTNDSIKPNGLKNYTHSYSNNNFVNQIILNGINNPDKIAINFEDKIINYESLNKKSSFISGALLKKGFNSNSVIAVISDSSIEYIIALIGILRIGATWVPIDENYPKERINKMLEISQADMIIDINNNFDLKNSFTFLELINEKISADFVIDLNVNKTAYIIFTSGSTGTPKGVPISYLSLENYLTWCNKTFDYNDSDKFIQTSSISFDASLRQILSPLICGGTVYPLAKKIKREPRDLFRFVQKNEITIWSSVPSLWSVFVEYSETIDYKDLPYLRMIKVGGEILTTNLVEKTQNIFKGVKIVNLYGPTETTINSTYHIIDKKLDINTKSIPIGKPSSNLFCSVHDELGELVLLGELGELYVSGIGLTSGYINDVELNSKKFFIDEHGIRYYKTGDIVSQNENYEYIFHGRKDRQIKIRGFRVELGEIENILLNHKNISNAYVKFENNILIGFIESELKDIDIFKGYLKDKLPEYLIPNKIIILKKFPLLENGKIDINSLTYEVVKDNTIREELQTHVTQTENIILDICSNLLKINNISIKSNFFNLGGDSILIMQMFIQLEKHFKNLPKISLFYKNGDLNYLAKIIDDLNIQESKTIINNSPDNYIKNDLKKFPLSPSQIGFFLVNKFTLEKDSSWKSVFCIDGNIDLEIFKNALNIIISRHQMLRVKLINDDKPYFQEIIDFDNFKIQIKDFKTNDINTVTRELLEEMKNENIDLNKYPLLDIKFVKINDNKSLLAIHSHHILSDALSFLILIKELLHVYTQLINNKRFSLIEDLKPLKKQFSDYVDLVNSESDEERKESLNYWKKVFKETYKDIKLNNDYKNNLKSIHTLNNVDFENIKHYSSKYNTTPFNFILTIFYKSISEFFKQKDIIIGIAHHGRDYQLEDINNIFGCFARSVPIRINEENNLEEQIYNITNNVRNSTSFTLNPIELIKEININEDSKINFNSILGSQFFLSYIDISQDINSNNILTIDWIILIVILNHQI
jgi:amino acid adenylation domain-containing protein